MADNLTNVAENKTMDNLTGVTPWTPTLPLTLALYTVAPTDSTPGTEVAAASYARTAITFGTAVNGVATNSADIIFPTAAESWGTIVAGQIFDSAGTPVAIWYGLLDAPKAIGIGDTFSVPTGSLSLSIS